MRISLFLRTPRNLVSKYIIGSGLQENVSSGITCKSHRLMQHAQIISSSGTGIYNVLPFGMRALDKLTNIIDIKMKEIDCQKLSLSCLSTAKPWKTSKRWESFGNELIKLKVSDVDHCLSSTHEESITSLVSSFGLLPSNDLPVKLYQIGNKYRAEHRPRFGLLRCREFLMKDLYTFDKDRESAMKTYEQICHAYENIFDAIEMDYIKADALCGEIGGEMSHEYLISSSVGEDQIFVDEKGKAWNRELDTGGVKSKCVKEIAAIEIGHTFLLGTKYSSIFGACFKAQNSERSSLYMGCFGLGVSRILAACVEALSQENEIRWPHILAPFTVCILPPKAGSKEEKRLQEIGVDIYANLEIISGLKDDIIIDDRVNKTIGKRLHDAKIIGFPVVIVIGKHILDENPEVEVIFQNQNKTLLLPVQTLQEVLIKELILSMNSIKAST